MKSHHLTSIPTYNWTDNKCMSIYVTMTYVTTTYVRVTYVRNIWYTQYNNSEHDQNKTLTITLQKKDVFKKKILNQ